MCCNCEQQLTLAVYVAIEKLDVSLLLQLPKDRLIIRAAIMYMIVLLVHIDVVLCSQKSTCFFTNMMTCLNYVVSFAEMFYQTIDCW